MSSDRRILVMCPDWDQPSGGVRKLYRHVDVLNAHGFNAFIEHQKPDFRCTWFENNTRIADPRQTWPPRTSDLLLCPEQVSWQMALKTPGVPKVIFNQNAYQTFMGKTDEFKVVPYTQRDFLATIVVSEDSRRYLEYVFPGHPIHRIHNAINPELFSYEPRKKLRIAFMPRKNKPDVTQLLLLLNCRGALEGIELLPIQGMNEAQVARALTESMIFLSLSTHEGSPMPPLEAMACGCITIGYDGFGGREYVNDEHAVPVPQEDVVAFAQAVERVISELRRDPKRLLEKGRLASEFVLANYSPAREEQDIVAAWEEIFKMPALAKQT
jgi:glycosyltransferase involved in cell wall biosynthesis